MLGIDYRENTIAITGGAVQNAQFDTGIPKSALAAILFIMVGANNSLAGTGIDDYVFSLDGNEWLNIKPAELRCLFEFVYSRFGGAVPATSDLTWVLPLYLLGILLPGFPSVGLPHSTKKVFLIRGNANLSAGSMEIGWQMPWREIDYVPYLVGQTINGLAASSNDQRFDFNLQQFMTVGFIMDLGATEFTRIRFFLAQEDGTVKEVADWKRDHILMMHQPYHAASISDPVFIFFETPIVIRPGSYLLVNTGAGYDGTQRIVPVQFIPARKATAPKPAAA